MSTNSSGHHYHARPSDDGLGWAVDTYAARGYWLGSAYTPPGWEEGRAHRWALREMRRRREADGREAGT